VSVSWLADKIAPWPTDKLIPYARNARTHSDAQVAQIAASIAEFGFTNPILAGSDGVIVAGHGRLAAAQKLGLASVPVVVLDHLTATQRRALVIADNRIAENAEWDEAMLRVELADLQDEGFDLDLTGFDADALAELMAGDEPVNEGQTDEDAVPEVGETPVSRPGDVWQLGPHRLLCGDATLAASYDALLDGEAVDMVFTDPPYNVNYANSAKDKLRGKDRAILNDNLGDGFYDFLLAALTPILAHCRRRHLRRHVLKRTRRTAGRIPRRRRQVVDLHHLGQAHVHARPRRLPAPVRADPVRVARGRAAPLVRRPRPERRLADQEAAEERSAPDHEAGRAGRARVAQQLAPGRHGARSIWRLRHHADRRGEVRARRALMELDPKYADVIVRRWEDFTGKKAIREAADQDACAS
jgi:hypothetical protein